MRTKSIIKRFCMVLLALSAAGGQVFPQGTPPGVERRGRINPGIPDIEGTLSRFDALGLTSGGEDQTAPDPRAAAAVEFSPGGVKAGGPETLNVQDGVVTIRAGGTYALSGTFPGGRLVVDSGEPVTLILRGLAITSRAGPAIELSGGGKKSITLGEGTSNSLTSQPGRGFPTRGALYSKDPLVINGTGELTIRGNSGDGVQSMGSLTIRGGRVTVSSARTALKGDSVIIEGGALSLDAQDEGIRAYRAIHLTGSSLFIKARDRGIRSGMMTIIDRGTLNIIKSRTGIEGAQVLIRGGTINLRSSEDGIKASGGREAAGRNREGGGNREQTPELFTALTGGQVTINAGGDGIDANGTIYISGGALTVHGPVSERDNALDADTGVLIHGGQVLAAGSKPQARDPAGNSAQYCLSLTFTTVQLPQTVVAVNDSRDRRVISYTAAKDFQSLIISSPDFTKDGGYSILVNGERRKTITLSGAITRVSL
ncbi:MAG: carbohydrate-binding domain-containing protein [Treponema sp.]|nr:carbohydrate-binding domain-containing protein [Treponema sp.]